MEPVSVTFVRVFEGIHLNYTVAENEIIFSFSMEDAQLRNYLAMKAAEESESDGEDADDVLGRTKPEEEKSSFEKRQERVSSPIQFREHLLYSGFIVY